MARKSLQPKLLLCISLPIIITIVIVIAATVAAMYFLAERWVNDSVNQFTLNLEDQLLVFSEV